MEMDWFSLTTIIIILGKVLLLFRTSDCSRDLSGYISGEICSQTWFGYKFHTASSLRVHFRQPLGRCLLWETVLWVCIVFKKWELCCYMSTGPRTETSTQWYFFDILICTIIHLLPFSSRFTLPYVPCDKASLLHSEYDGKGSGGTLQRRGSPAVSYCDIWREWVDSVVSEGKHLVAFCPSHGPRILSHLTAVPVHRK